jgi:predicted aspartyl protease
VPPRLDFEFAYLDLPAIDVYVLSSTAGGSVLLRAIIDTGADISVLDASVAEELGLELSGTRTY